MTADLPASAAAADPLRRARAAVALGFALGGLGSGVWLVHIPVVTARLAIGPAVLGFALLASNLAALAAQPLFAALVARLGSRRATALAMPLAVASFPLPGPRRLDAGLRGGPALDRPDLHPLQRRDQHPGGRGPGRLRPPADVGFHGFFSLGSLAAAGIAGALIAAHLGDGRGSLGVAAVSVAGALFANRGLVAGRAPPAPEGPPPARPAPARAPRLRAARAPLQRRRGHRDQLGQPLPRRRQGRHASAAALGFACYSLAMAAGRFAGGTAVARFGERRVVAGGGALVAAGIALAIAAPWFALSAAGFLVVGLGAANAIPVLIAAASRVPGVAPSTGVAAVMSGGGAGYLSPRRWSAAYAQGFGLAPGLAMIAACGLAVALTAARRGWSDAR